MTLNPVCTVSGWEKDMAAENWSGQDLSGYDFSGQTFVCVNLSGCDLSDCDFSGCSIAGSNFSGSDLSGADFRSCSITGSSFANCDLADTDFSNAVLTGCDFLGSNTEEAIGLEDPIGTLGGVTMNSGDTGNVSFGNQSSAEGLRIQSYNENGKSYAQVSLGKLSIMSSKFANHGISSGGSLMNINGVTDDRRIVDLNFGDGNARFENLGDGRTRVSLRLIRNGKSETVHEYVVDDGETYEIDTWGLLIEN